MIRLKSGSLTRIWSYMLINCLPIHHSITFLCFPDTENVFHIFRSNHHKAPIHFISLILYTKISLRVCQKKFGYYTWTSRSLIRIKLTGKSIKIIMKNIRFVIFPIMIYRIPNIFGIFVRNRIRLRPIPLKIIPTTNRAGNSSTSMNTPPQTDPTGFLPHFNPWGMIT